MCGEFCFGIRLDLRWPFRECEIYILNDMDILNNDNLDDRQTEQLQDGHFLRLLFLR